MPSIYDNLIVKDTNDPEWVRISAGFPDNGPALKGALAIVVPRAFAEYIQELKNRQQKNLRFPYELNDREKRLQVGDGDRK